MSAATRPAGPPRRQRPAARRWAPLPGDPSRTRPRDGRHAGSGGGRRSDEGGFELGGLNRFGRGLRKERARQKLTWDAVTVKSRAVAEQLRSEDRNPLVPNGLG